MSERIDEERLLASAFAMAGILAGDPEKLIGDPRWGWANLANASVEAGDALLLMLGLPQEERPPVRLAERIAALLARWDEDAETDLLMRRAHADDWRLAEFLAMGLQEAADGEPQA